MNLPAHIRNLLRHRAAGILCAALLPVAIRLILLFWIPIPKPAIQDEFSYLLAGQTFSLGRLANPPHPMWVHFETIHELSQPTYSSKYPPAMGLLLAAGRKLFGEPWFGVLLGAALLSAAVCWALQEWLNPAWAIAGALFFLMRIGLVSYWTESYWGGIPAAIGGALVIGAVPRLLRRPGVREAALFAAGVAILANSRPYEGVILWSACFLLLIWRLRKGQAADRLRCLVQASRWPVYLILLPTIAWMGYYNYRVTGDPLRLPYQLYESQYSFWSPFLWSSHPRPEPKYNQAAIQAMWEKWDGPRKQFERDHIVAIHVADLLKLDRFFLGTPLTICILAASIPMLRIRRWRSAWILLALFYCGLALESTLIPHYAAPATALIFVILTAALRAVLKWFPRQWMIRGPVFALFFLVVIYPDVRRLSAPATRFLFEKRDFLARREAALTKLNSEPGNHLVFVRYGPHHDVNEEWVYNDADIDRSRVVWAHAMPEGRDGELLRYYPNRRAWLLEDDGAVLLKPYRETLLQAAAAGTR